MPHHDNTPRHGVESSRPDYCLSLDVGSSRNQSRATPNRRGTTSGGEYAVGFRLLQEHDNTRVVAGPTEQARPVRIYLWYPAATSSAKAPMLFGRYAAIAEDDVWPSGISRPLREKLSFSRYALARSLGPEGFEALGEQPVRAFENAEPLPGPSR